MKAKHKRSNNLIPWLVFVGIASALIVGVSIHNDVMRYEKAMQQSVENLTSLSIEVEQVGLDEAEAEAQRQAEAEAAEAAAQEAISYYSYDGPGYYYDSQYDDMSDQEYIAWRESGWNYDARNGRYIGKYQMDESRLNGDWSPEHQEEVAEQYMLDRYGSWEAAREFWDSHGWW